MMNNLDIRKTIANSRLYFWEIAQALKMHPSTLSCKLRDELLPADKQRILEIIDELKGGDKH